VSPAGWAAVALTVLLAGPGLRQAARDVLDRRRATAAARTFTRLAADTAAAATETGLSPAESQWLAGYAAWLACHSQAGLVTGNGESLANQLRLALPDASDLDIARMLVASLVALRGFSAYREPRAAWIDALGAAALDLTRLERSSL
jgi:hypothetical protein